MVTADVMFKNGEVRTFYADEFPELFKKIEQCEDEVFYIRGKTINLKDMRQGREYIHGDYKG